MAMDQFAAQVEALRRRVVTLGRSAGQLSQPPGEADERTYQELQTALEELRVAEEELLCQNSELVAARTALEGERQRYQELFEFAPDPYLVTDPTGRIQEANRAAEVMLQVSRNFLVGKPVSVFIPREDHPGLHGQLARAGQAEGSVQWEIQVRPRAGEVVDVLITVAAVRDRQQRTIALRWLLRDVTRPKQEHRLAAIGQVVAGLAHEGRNALQRTQACLERLAWKLQDQPDAADLVARAKKAQDDLHRLFNDLREYAAPLHLELRLCNLAEVWQEAWANLAPLRRGRAVWLREDTGKADLLCAVDPFRLEQVFRNVLDNALAACADPVQIEIACAETSLEGQPAVRVAVRDNGPGLGDEQRLRIFEPFYTTKTRGTGLGMSIARRLVEAHGGRIAVGERPGPGAEVLITLLRRKL